MPDFTYQNVGGTYMIFYGMKIIHKGFSLEEARKFIEENQPKNKEAQLKEWKRKQELKRKDQIVSRKQELKDERKQKPRKFNRKLGTKAKKRIVYLLKGGDKFYKIGYTTDLHQRLYAFSSLPWPVTPIFAVSRSDALILEKKLHRTFRRRRILQTEWFELNDTEISLVINLMTGQIENITEFIYIDLQ